MERLLPARQAAIGRAIAAGLAADGFSVVVADLEEVNGRAAAEEIAASNQGRAIFQPST
jgi:NAD(P)-dependent dehydrogenase (short-subunit alcohol dehydrogenase family)